MNLISMTIIIKATVTISIFSIISITSISIPRSFHPPCTDFKHTQALHEMQNAPLWVQRQRPGSSQGIDHWHYAHATNLISTSALHHIRLSAMINLLALIVAHMVPHAHATNFFQKSCAKGRRNQLNMDEYGYGTPSAKQISAYHVRSLNWQPLSTAYKINANSSHPQTPLAEWGQTCQGSWGFLWWRVMKKLSGQVWMPYLCKTSLGHWVKEILRPTNFCEAT